MNKIEESERKLAITNITSFIESLNLDSIHEEFYVFCYLLWNGYLSIDKSFAYGTNPRSFNGYNDVFLGKSTSTGAAVLLTEVFKNKSIFTRTIGVSIQKIKLNGLINVKRNFQERIKDFSKNKKTINERVTYMANEPKSGATLILDPILLSECEVLSNGKLACINGQYKVSSKQLKYTFNGPFFYTYNLPKSPIINKEEVYNSYIKMNEFCEYNKNRFEDLYNENCKHYEKIKTIV